MYVTSGGYSLFFFFSNLGQDMKQQNVELIELFDRLSINETNPYKSNVFHRFAKLISEEDPEDIESLKQFKGVGDSCINIAKEFISTRVCSRLNKETEKKESYVPGVLDIPGIGPSKAKILISNGYGNPDELIKLNLKSGDIIPRTNIKVTKTMELGMKYMTHTRNSERMTRNEYEKIALPIVTKLKEKLDNDQIYLVGSYRRNSDSIGDIDIIIFYNETYDPDLYVKTIIDQLDDVDSMGSKKVSGIISGKHIDVKIIDKKYFGPMMLHFTGSVRFNVKMRSLAISKKMKLSEYGLYDCYGIRIDENTEESIFNLLGLKYLEPSKRNE